jgi:hypothetical protein
MHPRSSSIARSQKRSTALRSWVTNTIARPSPRSREKASKHFCWKAASPSASTSVDVRSLGYIQTDAPLTGALGSKGVSVSWASRFGLAARVG